MNFNINLTENQINTIIQNIVLFISFLLLAYGSSLIHIGLTWMIFGIFILRYTVDLNRLISVFINLPAIQAPVCNCSLNKQHIDDSDLDIIEDIFKDDQKE